jgi:hypothetical protein
MAANAGELFETMKVRLSMQEDGIINPSNSVKNATRTLVEKLGNIESDEEIEVVIKPPLLARYITIKTNEILAEIYE